MRRFTFAKENEEVTESADIPEVDAGESMIDAHDAAMEHFHLKMRGLENAVDALGELSEIVSEKDELTPTEASLVQSNMVSISNLVDEPLEETFPESKEMVSLESYGVKRLKTSLEEAKEGIVSRIVTFISTMIGNVINFFLRVFGFKKSRVEESERRYREATEEDQKRLVKDFDLDKAKTSIDIDGSIKFNSILDVSKVQATFLTPKSLMEMITKKKKACDKALEAEADIRSFLHDGISRISRSDSVDNFKYEMDVSKLESGFKISSESLGNSCGFGTGEFSVTVNNKPLDIGGGFELETFTLVTDDDKCVLANKLWANSVMDIFGNLTKSIPDFGKLLKELEQDNEHSERRSKEREKDLEKLKAELFRLKKLIDVDKVKLRIINNSFIGLTKDVYGSLLKVETAYTDAACRMIDTYSKFIRAGRPSPELVS